MSDGALELLNGKLVAARLQEMQGLRGVPAYIYGYVGADGLPLSRIIGGRFLVSKQAN